MYVLLGAALHDAVCNLCRVVALCHILLRADVYGSQGLSYGGPSAVIWTWVVVAVMSCNVAACMAELLSAFPTAGVGWVGVWRGCCASACVLVRGMSGQSQQLWLCNTCTTEPAQGRAGVKVFAMVCCTSGPLSCAGAVDVICLWCVQQPVALTVVMLLMLLLLLLW